MKTQSIFRIAMAALLLTSGLLFTQCKGPQGEPGPQGVTGATGATGPKGETGTANVIYGNWIDMSNPTFWIKNGIGFTANFSAPPITQDVLDKALILIYGRIEDRVYLTPYQHNNLISIRTHSTLNRIHIQIMVDNISTFGSLLLTGMNQYRYVIVPGVVNGRKAAIDYSNYEEVKKYYNLPD